MNINYSLRKKLTITHILLAVIPLISLSLILSWMTFQSQKSAAFVLQSAIMKRAKSEILQTSHEHESMFLFTIDSHNLLQQGRARQRNIISLLQSRKENSHSIFLREITLLDEEGNELVHVSRTEIFPDADLGSRVSSEEFIQPRLTGKIYYGHVFFNRKSLEPIMTLSVPMIDLRTGKTKGVLTGQIYLRQAWEGIVSQLAGSSGILYITDSTGTVVAHPNPSVVFRTTKVKPEKSSGIHTGMSGDPVMFSSEKFRLGSQSFYIITETPVAEALALSKKTLAISMSVLVVFLILAVGVGIILVAKIAGPIETLARTAMAISKGDYKSRADEHGYVEISLLSKSFNAMTKQLVGSITELRQAEKDLKAANEVMERRVLERTAELRSANAELLQEIESRKRTEETLNRYSQIVNSANDFITFIDRDYCHMAVNDSFLEVLGKRREELIGNRVEDVWREYPFYEEIKEKLDQAFAGTRVQSEHWFQFGAVGRRCVEVTLIPYFESGNKIGGVVINSRDVTERKTLERNLRQAEKMQAVGSLASGIAHDFNNVLHNIFGCARVAQKYLPTDSEAGYWLIRLQQVGERAADLVRQIQAFSQQREPVKISLDIGLLLNDAVRLQELVIPANIKLERKIAPCSRVLADGTQIHQVITNFIVNAVQAMTPQGGTLTVELAEIEVGPFSELSPGRYAQVSVKDTGRGMDKEIIERIFEPFFTTKPFGKGTGLGLAISHGIVSGHGGAIDVTSALGQGTVFSFRIPVSFSAEVTCDVQEVISIDKSSARILHVDDEEVNNEVWHAALTEEGFTVTTALSGREALDIFKKNPDEFDIVVTDQRMPEMSGTELAKAIAAIRPEIPIILITGWRQNLSNRALADCSIRKVLSKPVVMEDLLKTLAQVKKLTHRSQLNGSVHGFR